MQRIALIGMLLLSPALLAQALSDAAPKASPLGSWKVDGDVQGTPVKMTCVLAEAEQKVTGTCTDPARGAARPLAGEITAKGVVWSFDTDYQGTPITVWLTGTVSDDGEKMSGSISVDPMNANGTFTATKGGAGALPSPAAAPGVVAAKSATAEQALSMTGVWKVSADVMGQPVQMMCRLTDAAHALSGTCAGAQDNYAEHPVSGKVKAQSVEFHFQSAYQGSAITVSLTGTVVADGSKVNGDMDIEPMQAGGAFVAVRQE
jgi:hypothetical protein